MIAVLLSRMYALNGYDASQMQPAQMQPAQMELAQMQPAQMQTAQIQPSQMQAVSMQPAQMQAIRVQATQMQAVQMQPTQMQAARMPPAQMQAVQKQADRPQKVGHLSGLNNVPASRSTTTADVLSRSSEAKGSQPGIQKGPLIPLLPGPEKPIDTVALHQKVNREVEHGWKFDTRAWSKRPDTLPNYFYGFTREEYFFLRQQRLLNMNPSDIQWEIDRRDETDRLNALRPWYRNEGTDDSDLVPLSDAALSKELDAFYGGMENVKISDVTSSDLINGDRAIAAGDASNLSGENTPNSFVNEADSSNLPSKLPMKAGLGGCFIDSGICINERLKLSSLKPLRSSCRCDEESGIDRFPEDEDELTSDVHAPYDLEGLTSDRYHETACDLQLAPWQVSIGELTKQFLPKMSDHSPDQPSSSARLDSATSPLGFNKSATREAPATPSVEVAVRTPSLMGRPTKAKLPAHTLNSTSSESSLPSSPVSPTPQASTLWEKRVINAGLAPQIKRRYPFRRRPQPGDARYALLEQMSEMGARIDVSSGHFGYRAFSTPHKTRKTVQKRRASNDTQDAETGGRE